MPESSISEPKRDYGRLVERLLALDAPYLQRRELGRASDLPIYGFSAGKGPAQALLNGGTHGDEPAGPEAVLSFLQDGIEKWLDRFSFEIVPCLNPHGYAHDTRENEAGIDLNWGYEDASLPEIALMRRLVDGRRFAFVFDFHEDWESHGFYIYDVRRDGPPVGPRIIERVGAVCPINLDDEIEGDPANGGVISPDPEKVAKARGAGLPIALFRDHTDHFLTSESPTGLDMETRVRAQRAALEVVLEEHAGF